MAVSCASYFPRRRVFRDIGPVLLFSTISIDTNIRFNYLILVSIGAELIFYKKTCGANISYFKLIKKKE